MASHASHMLEAALEQMDDIIAGKFLFHFQSRGTAQFLISGFSKTTNGHMTSLLKMLTVLMLYKKSLPPFELKYGTSVFN